MGKRRLNSIAPTTNTLVPGYRQYDDFVCSIQANPHPLRHYSSGRPRHYFRYERDSSPIQYFQTELKSAPEPQPEEELVDFVTANCQVLVNSCNSNEELCHDPDVKVPWADVVCVKFYQTEDTCCPICLTEPVVPRIGPCGHIYCYTCAYHYIQFDNTSGFKKCAVCNAELKLCELKRVQIVPLSIPKVGDSIDLELVSRPKNSIFPVVKAASEGENQNNRERFLSRLDFADMTNFSALLKEDIRFLTEHSIEYDCWSPDKPETGNVKRILRKLSAEEKALRSLDVCCDNTAIKVAETECNPDNCYKYYQDVYGPDVYLHSINWRCLVEDCGFEALPRTISGRVIEVETYIMTRALRNRYRHLRHLPLGRTFYVVELELTSPVISQATLERLSDALNLRLARRLEKAEIEERQNQLKKEAEDRIPQLPVGSRLHGHAELTSRNTVPTDEDFVPLDVAIAKLCKPSAAAAADASPPSPAPARPARSFASVSSTGLDGCIDEHRIATFRKPSPPPTSTPGRPSTSAWSITIPGTRTTPRVPVEDFPSLNSAVPVEETSRQATTSDGEGRRNKRRTRRGKKPQNNSLSTDEAL